MPTPSFFDEPRLVRLGKFLSEIKDGELYVPRFQRPFVWTDKQRLNLLQSIFLGYPIGSILVWRTQERRLRTYERLGPLRLPEQDESPIIRQYLLDGHQRMTTLFSSLGPGLYDGDELEESWDDDDDSGVGWPVYFALEDEGVDPFRLPPRRGGSVPYTWLCLDILLDGYALGEFKDELRARGAGRSMVNRVQAVADIFRDYTIPVVPMATDSLEQVTTSFKRVNSGGSKMSEVHMVNALTWREDFDLLERLDELSESLRPVGWGSFEQQMVMNVCKAKFDFDIYKASAEELAEKLKLEPSVLDDVQLAIMKVAALLRELVGVHGPESLPYSYQAVLLADALREVPEPSSEVRDHIRKWFWLTTLTEYFQSMTSSLFRRAQLHLRDLLAGKVDATPPEISEIIEPASRFDFRSARSRAWGLMLASLGPRSPIDGELLEANQLLAQYGNDALPRIVFRRALPTEYRKLAFGPENRFLLHPEEGGGCLRAALSDSEDPQARILAKSHGVPVEAMKALQDGKFVDFLKLRQEEILGLERGYAERYGLSYLVRSVQAQSVDHRSLFLDEHDFIARLRGFFPRAENFGKYAKKLYEEVRALKIDSLESILEVFRECEDPDQEAEERLGEFCKFLQQHDRTPLLDWKSSDRLLVLILENYADLIDRRHPKSRRTRIVIYARHYRRMMDMRQEE